MDLPFATDGQGRLYIPGTSLAGPMRAWMEARWMAARAGEGTGAQPGAGGSPAAKNQTNQLWGYQPEEDSSTSDGGLASRITIEDAVLSDTQATLEIREGVGIDRVTGAAAQNIRFNRAILPTGTRIPFRLRADLPENEHLPLYKGMMADLLEALENGRIGFGAARTRGMGRATLKTDRLELLEPFSRAGMLAILRGQPRNTVSVQKLKDAYSGHKPKSVPLLTFRVHWSTDGPVMVKSEQSGLELDVLPLTGTDQGNRGLLLPGSSIKGVLRSMAERIIRTVSPREQDHQCSSRPDSSAQNGARRRFLEQLDVPLVRWLFGAEGAPVSAVKTPANGSKRKDISGGKSALTVDDCMASRLVSAKHWQELETAKISSDLTQYLNENIPGGLQPAMHLAVDRWTGGASDGKLFSGLEPMKTTWNPMTLRLELGRLPKPDQFAAVTLLLLVLRELSSGRLPVGFGTHRGYGAVKVERIQLDGEDLSGPEWKQLLWVTLDRGKISDLPDPLKDHLNQQWKAWIDRLGGASS